MSRGDDKRARKLDLLSSDFDALQALTVPPDQIQLPVPNAPIYDNMTWFVETESGILPRERTAKKKLASEETTASTSTATAGTSTGRGRLGWKMSNAVPLSASSESGVDPLSSSERVTDSVNRTQRVYKNVLINMDTAVGPLAFLKKCMDEKLRAKVIVRGAASIRGFCIGFVEAFDKHMNLVLKDVFETWKRPRRKNRKPISIEARTDAAAEEEDENVATAASTSGSTLLHKYRPTNAPKQDGSNENACYPIARWVVKRRTKKKDICERHVHQLLIRGEQVVCVMLDR